MSHIPKYLIHPLHYPQISGIKPQQILAFLDFSFQRDNNHCCVSFNVFTRKSPRQRCLQIYLVGGFFKSALYRVIHSAFTTKSGLKSWREIVNRSVCCILQVKKCLPPQSQQQLGPPPDQRFRYLPASGNSGRWTCRRKQNTWTSSSCHVKWFYHLSSEMGKRIRI